MIKMRVLSKQRITIFAAIKISGKGWNDPHSCPWNFNCDNYVSSGSSYANYPTAWCTILNDNSVAHVGKISAPLTKHKEALSHHSSSPLVPVLSQVHSAHFVASNTPMIYSIIPPKPWSPKWSLPSSLGYFCIYPLHASFPAKVSPTSFSYIQINNWTLEGKFPIANFPDISNVYMKQSAQLKQLHKS